MTVHDAEKVIKKIAKANATTVEDVRNEMIQAIKAGYNNPDTKEKWNTIFGEGVIPSPEQFICTMAEEVRGIAV